MLRFITLGVALSSFRRRDLNMYAVEPIHAFDLAGQAGILTILQDTVEQGDLILQLGRQAREIALVDKDVAVPNRL
jgi:hypothetical protein